MKFLFGFNIQYITVSGDASPTRPLLSIASLTLDLFP